MLEDKYVNLARAGVYGVQGLQRGIESRDGISSASQKFGDCLLLCELCFDFLGPSRALNMKVESLLHCGYSFHIHSLQCVI